MAGRVVVVGATITALLPSLGGGAAWLRTPAVPAERLSPTAIVSPAPTLPGSGVTWLRSPLALPSDRLAPTATIVGQAPQPIGGAVWLGSIRETPTDRLAPPTIVRAAPTLPSGLALWLRSVRDEPVIVPDRLPPALLVAEPTAPLPLGGVLWLRSLTREPPPPTDRLAPLVVVRGAGSDPVGAVVWLRAPRDAPPLPTRSRSLLVAQPVVLPFSGGVMWVRGGREFQSARIAPALLLRDGDQPTPTALVVWARGLREGEPEPTITGRVCWRLRPRSAELSLSARAPQWTLTPRPLGWALTARTAALTLGERTRELTLPTRPSCPPGESMTIVTRQFQEGTIGQGTLETIAYFFDSSPWGVIPTVLDVIVTDLATGADVSSTTLIGAGSVAGNTVTLPGFGHGGTLAGHTYRIDVQFSTADSTIWQAYQFIVVST